MDLNIVKSSTNIINIMLNNVDGTPYVLTSGESIIFGVKAKYTDNSYEITKTLTSSDYSGGNYVLKINPSDTSSLSVGKHFYDIGLKTGTSDYYNVVPMSEFNIIPNITVRGA